MTVCHQRIPEQALSLGQCVCVYKAAPLWTDKEFMHKKEEERGGEVTRVGGDMQGKTGRQAYCYYCHRFGHFPGGVQRFGRERVLLLRLLLLHEGVQEVWDQRRLKDRSVKINQNVSEAKFDAKSMWTHDSAHDKVPIKTINSACGKLRP